MLERGVNLRDAQFHAFPGPQIRFKVDCKWIESLTCQFKIEVKSVRVPWGALLAGNDNSNILHILTIFQKGALQGQVAVSHQVECMFFRVEAPTPNSQARHQGLHSGSRKYRRRLGAACRHRFSITVPPKMTSTSGLFKACMWNQITSKSGSSWGARLELIWYANALINARC